MKCLSIKAGAGFWSHHQSCWNFQVSNKSARMQSAQVRIVRALSNFSSVNFSSFTDIFRFRCHRSRICNKLAFVRSQSATWTLPSISSRNSSRRVVEPWSRSFRTPRHIRLRSRGASGWLPFLPQIQIWIWSERREDWGPQKPMGNPRWGCCEGRIYCGRGWRDASSRRVLVR